MESSEVYGLIRIGIVIGNDERVERSLDSDEKGPRTLTADHCFEALKAAIHSDVISHLLLNYAEKVYEEKCIAIQIGKRAILRDAVVERNMQLAERLVMRVTAEERDSCKILQLIMNSIRYAYFMTEEPLIRVLEEDQRGSGSLTPDHCFSALDSAIDSNKPQTSHEILDHAERVYETDVLSSEIEKRCLLLLAFLKGMRSIVERLAEKVSADELSSWKVILPILDSMKKHAPRDEDLDLIKSTLEADADGVRHLKAKHCFKAVHFAIGNRQKEIGDLLLDYAENVFGENISHYIKEWDLLSEAIRSNMASLLKRMAQKLPVGDALLFLAFKEMRADVIEELVAAGCSPRCVLDFDGNVFRGCSEEEETRVYEILLPHWTEVDVLQSKLLRLAIQSASGEHMMLMLEGLGMDFTPYISDVVVTSCMERALEHNSVDFIRFLIERGFDVDTHIASKPFLYHLMNLYRQHPCVLEPLYLWVDTHNIIVGVLMRCGTLTYEHVIDVCLEGLRNEDHDDYECLHNSYARILKLLICFGYRVPHGELNSVPTDRRSILSEVAIENSKLSSLQTVCRREIRLHAGSRIVELMQQLHFPEKLKDFVLLRDINLDNFKLVADLFEFGN